MRYLDMPCLSRQIPRKIEKNDQGISMKLNLKVYELESGTASGSGLVFLSSRITIFEIENY
ncbi:MAG: hypothetical protein WCA84_07585 [Ignavibacteriaceae bacterium]